MSVDVAVTGATGRMGRAVIEAARNREDVTVVLAVNRDPDKETVAGVPVEPADEFDELVAEREVDALVDFTAPESSRRYAAAATAAGVASVVGTTGFGEDGIQSLRGLAEAAPVLKASNFGRGVQALLSAVGAAVADLPGYDIEVTETHHNGKRDAPSGTANTILERIEEQRADAREARSASERASGEESEPRAGRVHGREGEAPREPGEIGVHARRAGSITGEHEVLLAGNHEELRLAHRAEDRGVFAEGALDAASWLAGREPGWYDFADVVEGDR